MKLSVAVSVVAVFSSARAASLRGIENDVTGPFDILKCTFEARADEEKCHESLDVDGEACDYCSVSSNGQEAGICVSADLADRMQQINPEVTCDQSKWSGDEIESVDLPTSLPSLQCTISAFTDEAKCAQVDNESCQYCQLDVSGQEAGLCVDAEVAAQMSQFSDVISCETPSVEVDVSGPFDGLKCTFEARADKGKCHESLDADGEACDYCTISSNGQEAGICVSSDLADEMQQINPEVTCDQSKLSGSELVFVDPPAYLPSLQCTTSAFTDEEKCAQVDNESCQYCQLDVNGQEVGLCVDADVAAQMSQFSDVISCETPSVEVDVSGPFDVLKCTIEARGDEEKCHESLDADGEACDYCTISSNGQEAGICVSADLADRMQQINPEVTCDISNYTTDEEKPVELSANLPSLQCTISAFTDEEKCAQVDNASCQYCQLDVSGQEAGLCVDAEVAAQMSQFSDVISCETPSVEVDVSGPFDVLECTIEARGDEEKCHESLDADGEACDYCTISSNGQEAGICVSSDLADKMQQINPDQITCGSAISSARPSDTLIDSFSTCLKVGLAGGDADTCRSTVDGTTGEHCTFCSSPNLDDIGLCMSSSFRGKHGRYYSCDASTNDIALSTE